MSPLTLRPALADDLPAIQAIYAHYVLHTTASLEETPPTVEVVTQRWQHSHDHDLPYLVATIGDQIAGYAYAFPYRPRSAYRFTVEESVYVNSDHQGIGVGRALLGALIDQCTAKGYRQMLAVISGADNQPSISLHERMGFVQAGQLSSVGYKFDRWIDTLLMQRSLVP